MSTLIPLFILKHNAYKIKFQADEDSQRKINAKKMMK